MTRPRWTYWHPVFICNSLGCSLQLWWWKIPRDGLTMWWPTRDRPYPRFTRVGQHG